MNSRENSIGTSPLSVLLIAAEGMIDQHVTEALKNSSDINLSSHQTSSVSAMSDFRNNYYDVVILDIGMPDEDGLTTIRRLIKVDRHVKIIMASTLSFANVRKSMAGFEQGAAEFIQPPSTLTANRSKSAFSNNLSRLISGLGQARRQEPQPIKPTHQPSPVPEVQELTLRSPSRERPKILAIGSSTGGPAALTTFLSGLPSDFTLPIVITQHMPATFTAVLATSISKHTGKTAVEGQDGMLLEPNHIYIAPGGYHMTFKGSPGATKIVINQDPPVNHCRPSVDPMVTSLAGIYGPGVLLVILTGMGADGLDGARLIAERQGTVIAQDFETSVVWGMPRAVAEAGLCSHILPLNQIADTVSEIVQ
jgi:two-component system chemotaxis response regulator CheB